MTARGNLALSGLADSGTRFKAVFRNVLAGVRLFVDAAYTSNPGSNQINTIRLTSSETGPFSAVAATNGTAAEIPISNGTATAVWEYLGQSPFSTDNEDLGVYVMASGNPAPATITVNAGYAPIGTGPSAPQFLDTSTAINLISTQACSMNVTAPASLGVGISGVAYGPVTLTASGGVPPYSWSAPDGSLPAGLSLTSAGTLSGTPSFAGVASFTANLADSAGRTLSQTFSITVVPPLALVTSALPQATAGANYMAGLSAAGGAPPYVWSIVSGSLPGSLTLNAAAGVISGLAPAPGSYNFTVRITDSIGQSATALLWLSVAAPLVSVQTAPNLPAVVAGNSYSQYLSANGGTAPYTWTLLSGALPTGLTLSPNGLLSGTPTAAGTFVFTAQVKDAGGQTASLTITLKVTSPPLTISGGSALPAGNLGSPYSKSFSGTGGVPPYHWGVGGGFIPPGLTLSSEGTLSGTPTVAGNFTFAVSLTDSTGSGVGANFTLAIQATGLSITSSSSLPPATVGAGYTASLSATGGAPPYRWSASMPAGLSLDPVTGAVSGTIAQPGAYSFTATVADSAGARASATISLAATMPAAPAAQITGLPATADAAAQPSFGIMLQSPYPFRIQGKLVLTFTPESGPDDPAVQFASGGRSLDFVIPPGQLTPVFATPVAALQTGTLAGRIDLTPSFQSLGVDITPPPAPWSMRIGRRPPGITAVQAGWSSAGLTVSVTGYANTRELLEARFRFDNGNEVVVPLSVPFARWMADPACSDYGGQFTLVQTFPDAPPSTGVVSVVLVNGEGSSASASATADARP
jgi:hypothetical protein